MTVECEKCQTRFHVADARIPAKGARVRCSRCHHRFHITLSSAAPGQSTAAAKDNAAEEILGGEAAREEDQLDNPEFIFDRPEGDHGRTGSVRTDLADSGRQQPHLAEPPEPATPPAPREERVVSSGGVTAQQMLDEGVPDLPTGRIDVLGSLGETDSLIGSPDEPNVSTASTELDDAFTESSESLAVVPPARPASAEIAAIAAELGEDEDSSFADWDPLSTPASTPAAGMVEAPAPAPTPATKTVLDSIQPKPAARPKRRALAEAPTFDPEAVSPIRLILRVAAVIVGLALLGAAGRILWLQRGGDSSAPEVVQAAGWIAADLETFVARNADGERVVVVRGNLFPEGSAPPPRVEVRLLGADGEALVVSPRTWLERIDDAEIAPERLELRLAQAGGDIAGMGQMVTGFTAVIPDPPPGIHRVEVSLRAPERTPAGTATADVPAAPPADEPAAAPATETASPSPAASSGLPESDAVVPAAPAPE